MKEKLQKILEQNPDIKAQFTYYYKYCFSFQCEGLEFTIGGDSGDIYRLDVYPETPLAELINYIE